MMHGPEKSDPGIVAMKRANKTEQSVAEPVERRAGTKGNVDQQSTCRTQSRISVSQALERIRKVRNALPSNTRGGSRMRESRTYGSVRGALSNERPYRVRSIIAAVHESQSGLGCVKTCAREKDAEVFSLSSSPDCGRQRFCFSN
jgi:hypothetical protein